MVNVAELLLPRMVTAAGGWTAVLSLDTWTLTPATAAGRVSRSGPTRLVPPCTLEGVKEKGDSWARLAGSICRVAVCVLLPATAVMVTVCAVVVEGTERLKAAETWP